MNASQRTTLVAKGISLFADLQDLPGNAVPWSSEQSQWIQWKRSYPTLVEFVMKEQSQLFDRVNAKIWE